MNEEVAEQFSEDLDQVLGQIANEYFDRLADNEQPSISEFVRRFPQYASELKKVLPALQQLTESICPESGSLGAATSGPIRQLGDFRIVREIGRGGMGIVYEAEQISMGNRLIALKVMPFAAIVNEVQLQRFRNEVRAAASLNHPNIVPVYSIGEELGVHFYAMQLVHGQSLASLIDEMRNMRKHAECAASSITQIIRDFSQFASSSLATDPTMDQPVCPLQANDILDDGTLAEAVVAETVGSVQAAIDTVKSKNGKYAAEHHQVVASLGIQAALALQHAHERGVVHRDIKPANLMVDSHAKLYLTDFGLAHMEENAGITMTGDLLGTLRYMSPEQALGNRAAIDHRTDIYSLGITLYELLTTEYAFNGRNRSELLRQITSEELRPIRQVERMIPHDVETIVCKATAKDPADRYQTAQELADDLKRFLVYQPILAKPPTTFERLQKWARRHPTVATSVSLLLVVSTIGAAFGSFLLQRQVIRAEAAEQAAKDLANEARDQADAAGRSAKITEGINSFLVDYMFSMGDSRAKLPQPANLRSMLDNATLFADQRFPNDTELRAVLHKTIGQLYQRIGELELAQAQFQRALEIIEANVVQVPALDPGEIFAGLGELQLISGRLDESEATLRAGLAFIRSMDVLRSVPKLELLLAKTHLHRQEFAKAESLAKRYFEARTGNDQLTAARASCILAKVAVSRGAFEDAMPLLNSSIGIFDQELGVENWETQEAIVQLADLHYALGRYSESEDLWRQILESRLVAHGRGHSQTLDAMESLAELLGVQEKREEAESLLLDVIKQRYRLGTLTDTQGTVMRLAELRHRFDDSDAIDVRALITEMELKEPPDALDLTNRYCDGLISRGEFGPAEKLLRQVHDLGKKHLGKAHPVTAESLVRLHYCLLAQRKLLEADPVGWSTIGHAFSEQSSTVVGEAEQLAMMDIVYQKVLPWTEEMLRKSLNYKLDRYSNKHLTTSLTAITLAQILMMQDKRDEAAILLQDALQTRQSKLPADHRYVREAESLYGACLSQGGQTSEAEPLLLRSVEGLVKDLSYAPLLKAEYLKRVADHFIRVGNSERAIVYQRQRATQLRLCLAHWEHAGYDSPSDNNNVRMRLGESLTACGDFDNALQVLLSVYRSTFLGQRNPSSAQHKVQQLLAELFQAKDRHAVQVGSLDAKLQRLGQAWQQLAKLESPTTNDLAETRRASNREFFDTQIQVWEAMCNVGRNQANQACLSQAYHDLGVFYVFYNELDQAVTWLDKAAISIDEALARDSNDPEVKAIKSVIGCTYGIVASRQGEFEKASSQFQQASQLARDVPRGQYWNQVEGPSLIEHAIFLATCPDIEFANPTLALEICQSLNDREIVRNRYAEALALYRLGKWQAVVDLLQNGRSLFDGLIAAMAHQQLGDRQKAEYHFQTSLKAIVRHSKKFEQGENLQNWWFIHDHYQLLHESAKALGYSTEQLQSQLLQLR